MRHAHNTTPDPQAILRAWMPFKKAIGVTAVRTEAEYATARSVVDALIDVIGDDESHPLAEVLDYLSDQMEAYEDEHTIIPEASPAETLRFLMQQHELKQEDLVDCAPQGRISDILNGRRAISKDLARKFARRFNVAADLFI